MYISGGVGGKGAGESTRATPFTKHFKATMNCPQLYCETCANIGNAMWNWRLLQATGEARFADVMEQTLYNAGLSGISVHRTGSFTATRWSRADATRRTGTRPPRAGRSATATAARRRSRGR